MRLCLHIFLLGIFCVNTLLAVEPALVVYETVPGEQVSEHYKLAVKGEAEEDNWKTAFAFITKCKSKTDEDTRYAEHLNGWSNTYINFEMSRPVVVAIGRVDGQPIRSAMAHPRRHVKSCEVRSGKVFVTIEKPCLIAVDIDGQMDGQDTGKGYKGQPIHTVTIFANPLVTNRPRTDDPSVLVVLRDQNRRQTEIGRHSISCRECMILVLVFRCTPTGTTIYPAMPSSMELS